MSWVIIVLAGAALAACIGILDKTIIHNYARTPSTEPLAIGFTMPLVGTVLLLIFGIPESATLEAVLLALASGAFYGLGAHILIHSLYTREVSRAIPVYQTYPIFTALIAFFFLGERLGAVEWLAVLAVVGGAVLISSGPGASRGFLPDKTFMLLMLGSLIEGSSFVLGKSAVNELPVLFAHALRMFALSSVLLAFNLRRPPLDDLISFFRTRSPRSGTWPSTSSSSPTRASSCCCGDSRSAPPRSSQRSPACGLSSSSSSPSASRSCGAARSARSRRVAR